MWKNINGRLIPYTDETRVKFRTNISKAVLVNLEDLAEKYNTFPNYLIESGLEVLMNQNLIVYNKDLRPKDRVQYKTTYDEKLLTRTKEFAQNHNLFINDVIEHSIQFIDFNQIKVRGHKYRIEKG